jgi:hypothetical protein
MDFYSYSKNDTCFHWYTHNGEDVVKTDTQAGGVNYQFSSPIKLPIAGDWSITEYARMGDLDFSISSIRTVINRGSNRIATIYT